MDDLKWCINYLQNINFIKINYGKNDEENLRALMNITMNNNLSDEFYEKQNNVLKDIYKRRSIVDIDDIECIANNIYLYKGDITNIRCDAIVNACNSRLLGCTAPLHYCIDNAIHSFAGLQVRRDIMNEMKGRLEPNGRCRVTKGYNLPAKYIFHTVGPIYDRSKQNEIDLRNSYLSCLKKADEMKLKSICFCSLSTGVFGYPINLASEIAINTVREYLNKDNVNIKKVIFNVFSDRDYDVYFKMINEIYK